MAICATLDVRVACWSSDEQRVLISVNGGRHQWSPVEYRQMPNETTPRGYIRVGEDDVCVFS